MMRRITGFICCLVLAIGSGISNGAMLLHYEFDEVNGSTTPDSSGRGYDGTLAGGMSASNLVSGKIGNALNFEGGGSSSTADRVQIADGNADFDRSYSAFTFMAWLKPTEAALAATGTTWIAGKMGSSGNRGWQLGLSGTTPETNQHELFVSYFDGPSGSDQEIYLGTNANVGSDKWVHLAFVFTANDSTQFYINGDLALNTGGALAALNGSNNAAFQVGNRGNNAAASWNGLIDDVYVFDSALTQSQIRSLVPEPNALAMVLLGLAAAIGRSHGRKS